MAALTYTTLTAAKTTEGSIRFWINYANIDPELIVRDAENWIGQNLRVRRMQARAELSLAEGESSISLAAEVPLFLDPIRLFLVGYGDLHFIHEDEIDKLRAADSDGTLGESCPTYWTVVGTEILFDVEADDDYDLVLSHYAKPTALSVSNGANIYTSEFPALMRAICTAYAYQEFKDEERASFYFKQGEAFIAKIAENDDLARRGMMFDVAVA